MINRSKTYFDLKNIQPVELKNNRPQYSRLFKYPIHQGMTSEKSF